jgi:PAS domain S-box-containing protein
VHDADTTGATDRVRDRLTGLAGLIRDAVMIIDDADVITLANHHIAARLDLTVEMVVGKNLFEVLPQLREIEFAELLERVRTTGQPEVMDQFVGWLDGWFQVDLNRLGTEVVVQVRDITETRRNARQHELTRLVDAEVVGAMDLGAAFRSVLKVICSELDFEFGEVWMVDHLFEVPRLAAVHVRREDHRLSEFIDATQAIRLVRGTPPERAMATLGVIATPVLDEDPFFTRKESARAGGLTCGVHLGLDLQAGRVISVGLFRCAPLDGDDSVEMLGRLREHLSTVMGHHAARLDLQQFFELTREFICISGLDGKISRVNPALANDLGYEPQDLLRRPFAEFVHPLDVPTTSRLFGDLISGHGSMDHYENRVQAGDGRYRWISWRSHAFVDEGLVFSTGRDVTDERSDRMFRNGQNAVLRAVVSGEPLEHTLQRIAALVESLDEESGVVVFQLAGDEPGPHTHELIMTPGHCFTEGGLSELGGLNLDAILGPFPNLVPDGRPAVTDDICSAQGWSGYHEVAEIEGFVSARCMPVFGIDDRLLAVLAVCSRRPEAPSERQLDLLRDAVHLTGIAIQRSRAHDEISRNEERFRRLAEVVTDAIFEMDISGPSLWRSSGFQTLFGYTDDQIDRSHEWWASRVHPDDRDRVSLSSRAAIDSGQNQWLANYRFLRADGSYAEVSSQCVILRDGAGTAIRIIGGISDVTERRQIERQHLRRQRAESLGTLAAGIAHDLNNNLAPITMAVDLLRSSDLDDDVNDTVDVIEASARRSADMVRKILEFARGMEGESAVCSVADLVGETVGMVRDSLGRSIRVDVHTGPPQLVIRGDRPQLHQAVVNLLLNAVDLMPQGGKIDITVDELTMDPDRTVAPSAALNEGRYVRIRVSDTGPGLTPEAAPRMFGPFFTTKSDDLVRGLGLSSAQAIARNHGGDLVAEPTTGTGATFDLWLPIDEARPASDNGSLSDPEADDDAFDGDGVSVLVVDDEPAVRALIRDTLVGYGYRVFDAADGLAALEIFDQHRAEIDLVLTDVMMAGIDGVELSAKLREGSAQVAVVAMTGLQDFGRLAALEASGVEQIIAKPFARRSLLVALRDALGR